MTVFGTKTGTADIACCAAVACAGSSSTSSRTRTLVSTARISPPELLVDRGVHLFNRSRRTIVFYDTAKIGNGELFLLLGRLEQHALRPLFHGQAHTGLPAPLVADRLRQHNLAFGRDRCLRHVQILPVR